ncbi:alpha-ketoglutarate-dependent dioxygenase alkB homolog 4 isoform X2 [Arctopsyche grandis]|uniref:alpha-ketoglutarate-dependent dioxygenase alkB homolog 4 isoform X2 n=1 Tax=Arctopsyche grandis TaxID=121162 RepID=UPI00406D7254
MGGGEPDEGQVEGGAAEGAADEAVRPCGCKGCRSCLLCETAAPLHDLQVENCYVYCPQCNLAWKGWNENIYKEHPNHSGESISFPGVYIQLDFISELEENALMKGIDEMPWDLSQSGRRKQNFGPKTNFKKKRLRIGDFKGFPEFSRFVQEKFQHVSLLNNYRTIEQCSLEYDPARGASIDPHIDDCWVWGERIITVNCLAESVLTMTPYLGDVKKYNLEDCSLYNRIVNEDGQFVDDFSLAPFECKNDDRTDIIVRLPMPKRSLMVLYGPARYMWEHRILREDITERRVCLAYREFTPPFLPGGNWENEGSEILDAANSFWNHLYVEKVNS